MERLNVRNPDICGMRQDGEVRILYEGGSERPLGLMGDGFRAAVLLSMYAHLKGCTIAVEEPERRMHPSLIYQAVQELLIGCRDSGTQVFLSTHSLELAEYALEKAPAKEYASVFQLAKSDDTVYAKSFDRDEALDYLTEPGLDIRGM